MVITGNNFMHLTDNLVYLKILKKREIQNTDRIFRLFEVGRDLNGV